MASAGKLPTVVLIVVLLLAASWSRAPQGDQASSRGESASTEPDSNPTAPSDECLVPIEFIVPDRFVGPDGLAVMMAELSTRNRESTDTKANGQQGSVTGFRGNEIDICSGDTRGIRLAADGLYRYEIYESDLSREVRRLGIPIPKQRAWERVGEAGSRMPGITVCFADPVLFPPIRSLLTSLDQVNATDEERRDVLGRLMTNMQTTYWRPMGLEDTVRMADALDLEVRERHHLQKGSVPGNK